MTASAWNWLPDGALSSPAVLGPLDAAVATWSERWFQDFALSRRRVLFGASAPVPEAAVSTSRLDLRLSNAAPMALLSAVMKEDVTRVELTDVDWSVLEGVRSEMLDDLAQTLDAALDASRDAILSDIKASGAISIELADPSGRVIATLDTTRAVLARARLGALPPPARASLSLTPRTTAVSQAAVRLEVRLGSTVLPMAEARRLSRGDVIILDRALEQPLELAAASTGSTVACGRLVDTSSPRSLRLEAAPVRVRP